MEEEDTGEKANEVCAHVGRSENREKARSLGRLHTGQDLVLPRGRKMEKNVPVILPTSRPGLVSAPYLSNSGSLLLPGRGDKLGECGVERAGTHF